MIKRSWVQIQLGELAFSLLFYSLFLKSVSLKRDLEEVEMFLILTFKMLSCATWGEASLMCPRISQKASSVNSPIQAVLKFDPYMNERPQWVNDQRKGEVTDSRQRMSRS